MDPILELQPACAEMLRADPRLPAGIVILERLKSDIQSELEAALSKLGLTAWVMPCLPLEALDTAGQIMFFPKIELRVRIVENTALNATGMNIYKLMAVIMKCLGSKNPDDMLEQPLQLRPGRPVEYTFEGKGGIIAFDVVFISAAAMSED